MRRIRKYSIIGAAVLVMLSGGGFVAGTLFIDSVALAEEIPLPQTSTLFYSDGQTVLARLGTNTRFVVKYEEMSPYITQAMVASEDRTFWTNEGVEFSAVIRAAWNNVTGGAQQGGSTITQQYARIAFEMREVSYNRKVREAIYAWKITDRYEKKDILASYLNSVEFGRHTFGAEAAARAFFGASIKVPPEPGYREITRSEAMALVAMVKQPYPSPTNPDGEPGYDPTRGEPGSAMRKKAEELALGRWNYVKDGLLELHASDPGRFDLTPEEAQTLTFPTSWIADDPAGGAEGLTKPAGLVKNHVMDELSHSDNPNFAGKSWQDIADGGYDIITTLDARAQAAAERAADETVQGSVMFGRPENMQAALVAIEPGTGRVLAYYGGHDGTKVDFAGTWIGEDGSAAGHGRHPPGSSFKVYTLAAALREGISLDSYWQWTPHEQGYRGPANPIRNSADCTSDLLKDESGNDVRGTLRTDEFGLWTDPEGLHKSGSSSRRLARTGLCTLLESTVRSLNVPFIDVTLDVSPRGVLQMAHDAGINYIWNNEGKRIDLREFGGNVAPATTDFGIGIEVGIGQYGVTVLEHANGIATFAAGGRKAEEHFVKEVRKGGEVIYSEKLAGDTNPVLTQGQVNDLTYALNQVGGNGNANIEGFQAATKTGTWEFGGNPDQNAHAWNVGFTTKLAAAVWIGNKSEEQALVAPGVGPIYGSTLPRDIWVRFIREATRDMALPKDNTKFNPPSNVGDPSRCNLCYPSPTPTTTPTEEPTQTPTTTTSTTSSPPSTPPPTTTSAGTTSTPPDDDDG